MYVGYVGWVFFVVLILGLKMKFAEMKTSTCSSEALISHHIIKTNNGKFNIQSSAVKVWKNLDESIYHLTLASFNNKVKLDILQTYC